MIWTLNSWRYSFLGLLLFFTLRADAQSTVSVWGAPAEQKIRPDDPIETENLVWSKDNNRIQIAGAGNEHAAFQVVITTPVPPGRKPEAPGGFFIKVSDLRSEDGKTIPDSVVHCYLEHYIMLYGKSSPIGETGYWPDALAPIAEPFSMQAQFDVVGNRPLWVDIAVPAHTPGGLYKGTVEITQHDRSIARINLELQVYHFSLPDSTHLITYMNISKGWLASFYHQSDTSAAIDSLTQIYYDFLYRHRMEPWFNDQLKPTITITGDQLQVKFNDSRYQYYMNQLHTKRVLLNAYPGELKRLIKAPLFSDAFNRLVGAYLSQVEAYFDQHGWHDRLVFNSPIDEPGSKEAYEHTRQWGDLVHHTTHGVPFLATKSPVTDRRHQDWGTLRGYVNNFSIHGNALNEAAVKQAIVEEKAKGGEMTWYISCDQAYPQPNYFIDAPALDLVMVPWITARYHMDGILYWGLNFWPQTPNPWLDAVTYISGFECSSGYVLNGEGSVLYPGDYTRQYTGEPNVHGPVSSIRMELLRDGIEDYEYLWLLGHEGAQAYADSLVRNMVVDVSAFSRNVESLYQTRRAMAERLEALTAKKP